MTYKQKLKRNVKLAYISVFFIALIFVIPIWVAFETRILNFTQIALISAICYGITTLLELPSGALADLIGRRKTIILGWLISGLGNVYIAFASSFAMFFTGYAIVAIGTALISGADTALIFDTLKELGRENYYSKYAARAGMIYRSALILATFLGGYLYQIWIGLPYALMGLTQWIAILFILLMVEPRIDTEKFTLKSYLKQTRDGFKELLKSSYMKKLTVYYTLVGGITWSCLYYFNQPFAKDLGFSEIGQSWLFGTLYLLSSLLILILTENDKLLTRNRIYLGFPLIMSFSLLPGYFATKILAPLLLFGNMFSGSARFAILDRYTNKEFLSKYRATAISALNMLVSLFYMIVVGISGKIQDIYSTKLIFTILGGLTLIFVLPTGLSLVKEYKYYLKRKNKGVVKIL